LIFDGFPAPDEIGNISTSSGPFWLTRHSIESLDRGLLIEVLGTRIAQGTVEIGPFFNMLLHLADEIGNISTSSGPFWLTRHSIES